MEPLELETSDGQQIDLEEPLVSSKAHTLIQKSKEKINRNLSHKAWRVALDILAVDKLREFDPELDVDMSRVETNPFLKNQVTQSDAKQLIILLTNFSSKESDITDKVLQAFILFTKGIITKKSILMLKIQDKDFFEALEDDIKTTLDKYLFLHFNKHFTLPKELLASVTLAELIKCRKINDFIQLKKTNNAHEVKAKICLENCSLAHLEGWHNLFSKIEPSLVCIIDLSSNNLTELPENLLKGFFNLKKMYLNSNKLNNLPAYLFNDCEHIDCIDLRNNQFTEIPVISEYNLTQVFLDNNPLSDQSKELIKFQKKYHFQKDKISTGEVITAGILGLLLIYFLDK